MTDELRLDGGAIVTSETIKTLIRLRHTDINGKLEGILLFELATWTGHAAGEPNRIDAWHMADIVSKGLRRVAYEIKVSRSDFLRELREPKKRRAALRVSNQFYFVTPPGIVTSDEIPLECGLLQVVPGPHPRLATIIDAPFRDGMPASWHFFAAVGRRLLKAETAKE